MTKLPTNILLAVKRIADKNGVSADEVVRKFMSGTRKSAVSRSDFFWGHSDISLSRKNSFWRPSGSVRSTRNSLERR